MARIRTIKPEFWDDQKIASLPIGARLLFIGIWNFSDDFGIVRSNSSWLKARIFPYDESLRALEVNGWIDALVNARMLIPLEYEGEGYYKIRTFDAHQIVNRPGKRTIPENVEAKLIKDSLNIHGTITEQSSLERKGKEGNGKEVEGNGITLSLPPIPASADSKINDATDRNALAQSLGKPQVSDSEILIWQNLLKLGCDLKDVESARKAKGKNSLHYLKNIVCEERDKRLTGGKKPGFDVFEALKEKRENGNA